MDVLILVIAGCAAIVVLVIAIALCAKRKSFTISHDFDYTSSYKAATGGSAYRVRHVHRESANTSHGNGNSRESAVAPRGNGPSVKDGSDQVDGGVTRSKEQTSSDLNGNKNAELKIVNETSDSRMPEKNSPSASKSDGVNLKVNVNSANVKEVEPAHSKRKAPTSPTSKSPENPSPEAAPPTTSAAVVAKAHSPQKKSSVPVKVPKYSANATSPSKKAAPTGGKITENDQHKHSKKKAPTPPSQTSPVKQPPTLDAANQESPIKQPLDATAPRQTETNSLPKQPKKETSGGAEGKSSTLPGRTSHKRKAPVTPKKENTPGPAQTTVIQSTIDGPPEVNNESSASLAEERKKATGDKSASKEKREKTPRNILDRLPSIPDNSRHLKETTPVVVQADSVDGDAFVDEGVVSEEDPYSVIKRREEGKRNEESKDAVIENGLGGDTVGGDKGDMDPPYARIKNRTQQDTDKSKTPQNDANAEKEAEPKKSETGDSTDGVDDTNKDIAEINEALDELVLIPEGSPIGDQETKTKAEPPYAKVIKKNRRNRGNVRVRFAAEDPTEIPRNKPPTPGALVTMNGGDISLLKDETGQSDESAPSGVVGQTEDTENRSNVNTPSTEENRTQLEEGPSFI